MGDHHDAHRCTVVSNFANSGGNDAQGIDVKAGVGFVENCNLWFEKRHLHDFVALLFTA